MTGQADSAGQALPKAPPMLKMWLRGCFGFGGIFLIAALVLAMREWRFIATSQHATATVSRIDREWMSGSTRSDGSRSGGNWGYRVVSTFPTADGRTIEARSPSLTSFTSYKAGDQIGVDYPSGQPERAQLVRFVDRWMLELVLGGIGAVAIAIGGFAVWLLRQPGTRVSGSGLGFSIQSATVSVEGDARQAVRPTVAASPAPDSPAASSPVGSRGIAWKMVAIVLLIGVAIGLLAAHFGGRRPSANDSLQGIGNTSGSAGARIDPTSDGGAPGSTGYPSNLIVSAPTMPDSSNAAPPASWTDPGNGGVTGANLTMAARAFLARPEQDTAMQAALRGQVARLGLDCPAVSFAVGETRMMAAPSPSFDQSGTLQRGLIRQRFFAQNCPGRSPEFNVWIFAAGDGSPIRTVAGYPGTTRADLSLMRDATPIVLAIAARLAPGCQTLAVSDTHLSIPAPGDATSPWSEDWLAVGCGKRIALTVRFIPEPTRGMTRIEVPETMARILGPQ